MTTVAPEGAIAVTAQIPVAGGTFTGSFSKPPTQIELQYFAAYGEARRQAVTR